MIKLFERMKENRTKAKDWENAKFLLRMRLDEIRMQSGKRGSLLEHEIEEGAKQALKMLQEAFKEIDCD